MIEMTALQRRIMQKFYSRPAKKVIFDKIAKSENALQGYSFKCACIRILNDIFQLDYCKIGGMDANSIPKRLANLFESCNLTLVSRNLQNSVFLLDGESQKANAPCVAFVGSDFLTIEFKEPWAKSSEPDLPRYDETGEICDFSEFLQEYPQFAAMLKERSCVNFFEVAGSNVHDFSPDAIRQAVSENYSATRKFADVICTEDAEGFLTMMPANQVGRWAKTEGEIRPAGRNHFAVWTPAYLKKILTEGGAKINGEKVFCKKSALAESKERGGTRISRYKINPLFFVRVENCEISGDVVSFNLKNVRQLKPTIAAKMDFRKTLKRENVKEYYFS